MGISKKAFPASKCATLIERKNKTPLFSISKDEAVEPKESQTENTHELLHNAQNTRTLLTGWHGKVVSWSWT